MTFDAARRVVLEEGGRGEAETLSASFHAGFDPGSDRMRRAIAAVGVVAEGLGASEPLNRELAAALWDLGHWVWEKYWLWPEHARALRPGLEDEVVKLFDAADAVLAPVPG